MDEFMYIYAITYRHDSFMKRVTHLNVYASNVLNN